MRILESRKYCSPIHVNCNFIHMANPVARESVSLSSMTSDQHVMLRGARSNWEEGATRLVLGDRSVVS